MVNCQRCGRFFLSTNQFKTVKDGEKEILLCPNCVEDIKIKESTKQLYHHSKAYIAGGTVFVFVGFFIYIFGSKIWYDIFLREFLTLLSYFFIIFGFISIVVGCAYEMMYYKSKEQIDVSVTKQITSNERTGNQDAINILNIRYAKGEITNEQYEKMKKDLEG